MLAVELCRRSGQTPKGQWTQLSTGQMGDVWRCGDLIVKCHDAPPIGLFSAEAKGLEALRQHGLRTPKLYVSDPAGLVMEYLRPGPDRPDDLAIQLAHLHRDTHHSTYGWPDDVYLGRFYLGSSKETPDWMTLWRTYRIEPLLRETADQLGALVPRIWTLLDQVEVPEEGPRLIHGDLWSGNVVMSDQGAAFIDPSVWYGERGVDLAMMRLFGGFSHRFWEQYERLYPIPASLKDALPYYQLYYVLVHVHLFGVSYCTHVRNILKRYGV